MAKDATAAALLRGRTLTALYNQRGKPEGAWLDALHRALDEAVTAAYGWPGTIFDDDALMRLPVGLSPPPDADGTAVWTCPEGACAAESMPPRPQRLVKLYALSGDRPEADANIDPASEGDAVQRLALTRDADRLARARRAGWISLEARHRPTPIILLLKYPQVGFKDSKDSRIQAV